MSTVEKASAPFAVGVLTVLTAFYLFAIAYYFRFRKYFDRNKFSYFGEFFSDLNNAEEARLHPVLLLTRRVLFVGLLVLLPSIGSLAIL